MKRVKIVSVKQLCEILDISKHTIYKWRQEGVPIFIEKPLRFDLDDVLRWLRVDRDIARKKIRSKYRDLTKSKQEFFYNGD